MIKLFLAVLCVLGLAFNPAATSGAIAAPAAMPGCTMYGHMPAKPADHAKMNCCTAACQVTTAALLPDRESAGELLTFADAQHDRAPAKELASFTASGLDPPPRLPS